MSNYKEIKYLILGGGPAGLAFANRLLDKGESSFLILEKEKSAGGLCRSQIIAGAPLDIGGGHFLDTKDKEVNEYLFRFLNRDEWQVFSRDSRIRYDNFEINHPFEANIWQLPIEKQMDYLESIARAGCNTGKEMPGKFVDWIIWKLGTEIAKDYMIPYNQKMFGENLNELGNYWLEKLPNVSFRDTLRSCIERKAYGIQPGHATFLYPKNYGYGELWERMAKRLGVNICYEKSVEELNIPEKKISCLDGTKYSADYIIVTIPWMEFKNIIGLPEELKVNIKMLKYTSVQIEFFNDDIDTPAHWIYYPQKDLGYHRILVRKNFASGSAGYWTETNLERTNGRKNDNFKSICKYAYPLNTIDKPVIMQNLLLFMKKNEIYGLGRWGEHQHYNSDVTVKKAFELAVQFK